jgi:hypothetical protein
MYDTKQKGTEMGWKNMLALTCCVCGDDTHGRFARRIQKNSNRMLCVGLYEYGRGRRKEGDVLTRRGRVGRTRSQNWAGDGMSDSMNERRRRGVIVACRCGMGDNARGCPERRKTINREIIYLQRLLPSQLRPSLRVTKF